MNKKIKNRKLYSQIYYQAKLIKQTKVIKNKEQKQSKAFTLRCSIKVFLKIS